MGPNATHLNIKTTDNTQWKTSDTLTWDGSDFRVGGEAVDFNSIQNCFYQPYSPWISTYQWTAPAPNKTELAFKIVGKLLEKKLIDEITVGKFIALVNEIAALI